MEELGGEGIGRQGQMLQEPEPPGASQPIFRNTATTLSAAQDVANSYSRKSRQKSDVKEAVATYNPTSASVTEFSVPKSASTRISNTS